MANPGLSIAFAASAGKDERHWIRVEQVQPDEDVATLADAARLIDSLYQINPCVTGTMGTGGDAGTDEALPDENGYFATARSALDLSVLCTESEYWEAQVDVFRSHRNQPFRLVSETAQVGSSTVVSEQKTEHLNLSGANSVDLAWPYHLGLAVSGATVAGIRGSTVNFTAPVSGPVTLSYQAIWDRVTVRVPQSATANGTKEADAAGVVAFQGDMAAACVLTQPDPDNSMSATERERLCTPSSSSHGQIGGDCWQTVEHYSLCNCSGSEAPGAWQETVSVPCPAGVSGGAHTGSSRQLAGYVYCEGEEDEVNDPEFYEKTCCTPPPKSLPRCKRTSAVWSGGAEIAGGADRFRAIYGGNVQLTAITPEEGCGKKVWEWDTTSKNCCDEITPLWPDPDNPTEFHAGESHWIEVHDGKPGELKWQASGGLYFLSGGQKVHTIRTPARKVFVYAEREGVCPMPFLVIDDQCKPLRISFIGGGATPVTLPYEEDLVIAPEQRFYVTAYGGVPPLRWQVGGQVKLISWDQETGHSALFEADEDFCGTEMIEVVDACGESDTVAIRSTEGRWEEITDYDRYSAPWGGTAPSTQLVGNRYRVNSYKGYRADIWYNQFSKNFIHYPNESAPHLGSCEETIPPDLPQYTGMMLAVIEGISPIPCTPYQTQSGSISSGGIRYKSEHCYGMCANYYTWVDQGYRTYESRNTWSAQYQWIVYLWRWVCPDGSSTQ